MPSRASIFTKQRLTAGQLRAVAERRFGDAETLVATGDNARANGAQYLSGIVVEILLKGQLMVRYPIETGKQLAELTESERPVWSLVWRSHDLPEMLERLPQVRAGVRKQGERAGLPYLDWLNGICSSWTVYARYSSLTSNIAEARDMVDRVRQLKEVLK